MAPILANAEVQQRLTPYLPSGESLPQSSEELSHTISSPQFQQVQHKVTSQSHHQNNVQREWTCFYVCTHVIRFVESTKLINTGLPFQTRCTNPPFCRCFLQAMSMFSSALASGQLGPLMNQFGLPAEAVDAANKGGQCFVHIPCDRMWPFRNILDCSETMGREQTVQTS